MADQKLISRSLDSDVTLGVGANVNIGLGPALPLSTVRIVTVTALGVGVSSANSVVVFNVVTGIRGSTVASNTVVGAKCGPASVVAGGAAGLLTVTYVPGTAGADDVINIAQAAGVVLKLAVAISVVESPITGTA